MSAVFHKIIQQHHLLHIPELKISLDIFSKKFSSNCKMCHCNGKCCGEGVLLDLEEKKRILAYADVILRYLEPQQEHDVSKWFDESVCHDIDFPSGICDGTTASDTGCVFLDSKGLCALQKTAMGEGMNKFFLKPFYCVAFPVVIDGHVLTVDDPDFTNRPQCCSVVPDGSLSIFDVCREEFEYILGMEGFQELERMFSQEMVQQIEGVA
jgi:hypothetical protein